MTSTWQDVHTTAYMCSSETTQVCCDIKFWQYFNNFRYMFEDRVAPNPSKSSEPTSYETYHLPVCDQTWLAGKSLRQMEVFSCEQLRTKWWILQPLFHVAPMECLAWCSNKPWPWHAMAKVGTWHHLHLEKRETVELDEVRGATPPKKKSPVLLNLSIMFHLNNFEHGLSNWRGSRLTGKTFLATALDSRALWWTTARWTQNVQEFHDLVSPIEKVLAHTQIHTHPALQVWNCENWIQPDSCAFFSFRVSSAQCRFVYRTFRKRSSFMRLVRQLSSMIEVCIRRILSPPSGNCSNVSISTFSSSSRSDCRIDLISISKFIGIQTIHRRHATTQM